MSNADTGGDIEIATTDSSNRLSPPALDMASFRGLAHRAVDLVLDHLSGIESRPVFRPLPPEQRLFLLDQPFPNEGVAPEAILDYFVQNALPYPMGNGHPRFFGWVNSPPAPLGVIGDFLASAMNPSCAGGHHAAIYLERCAMRWLMELIGFPTVHSMGILLSGGSMASLTCLAAARHWGAANDGWNVRDEGLSDSRPRFVLYVSEEGHSCLRKAAELLGIGSAGVRTIPVNDGFQMDLNALRDAVSADRAKGNRPFCVAASAGTVNTGAIDPLEELADFCTDETIWLHVDGAYGSLGILVPDLAARYAGMGRADSIALDPHKWLSVPVECGCALVRDGRILREAFSLVPSYLRTEEGKGFGGLPWFSEYGFQQTRGFRALKLWMVLQHVGRAGLADLVARHVRLAKYLADLVDTTPDLERLAPVELSIVCFRYAPPELRGDDERLSALNKTIMERVQAGGEAFLSGTVLCGQFALRACILHYGTSEEDVHALIDAVRRAGREELALLLALRKPAVDDLVVGG
jgi:glutamate/tyrosine decarboxylase-like PLP-dependent enzyme